MTKAAKMMSLGDTYVDTLTERLLHILSSRPFLRAKAVLLLKVYPEWPSHSLFHLSWKPAAITRIVIKPNMLGYGPARDALKGMEIVVPPGHDLPPQQSSDPYASRPLPPIPPRSPARGVLSTSTLPPRRSAPAQAPPRSPARLSASRPMAPPPEFWKMPDCDLAHNSSPRPPRINTRSSASGDGCRLDLPLPDPPFIRKRSWSIGGIKADTNRLSQPGAMRNPTLTPTLHNSPDKIKQMIGHDVNANFDTGHTRVQSDAYESTTYTAPASPASSSCYSDETVETTVSEPATRVGHRSMEYDEDPERTLVAEGFNFHPSHKALPESPMSAHVDPLIVRRRAEVMSGEIRIDSAIHGLARRTETPAPCQFHDLRPTSASGSDCSQAKREEYIIKDLYHSTTAHIAASSKRREIREAREMSSPSPSKQTPWAPLGQAMTRLSCSSKHLTAEKRNSRLTGLPFPASAFEVGDRPLRTPALTSLPASAFEAEDARQNYMAKVFSRRSSIGNEGTAPVPGLRDAGAGGARLGVQGLVAQARRGAGLLKGPERRRASLRHKIRVIPEG